MSKPSGPTSMRLILSSRADPYCTRHGATRWSWSARPDEIAEALQQSHLQFPPAMRAITIRQRTDSSRAKLLDLEGDGRPVAISASSFRFAIGRTLGWNTLRSDRYEIESGGARIHFQGTGEGHGVGLCQQGADEMGVEGYGYHDILAFYYPGTTVALTGSGLNWVQMGGEDVTVFSTRPDRDRNVARPGGRFGPQSARAIAYRCGAGNRDPHLPRYRHLPECDGRARMDCGAYLGLANRSSTYRYIAEPRHPKTNASP